MNFIGKVYSPSPTTLYCCKLVGILFAGQVDLVNCSPLLCRRCIVVFSACGVPLSPHLPLPPPHPSLLDDGVVLFSGRSLGHANDDISCHEVHTDVCNIVDSLFVGL